MSEKSRFANRGLGLLVIYSPDMQRSVEFYQSLGLQFEQHSHPPCGDHFATLGDGCTLEIYPRRTGEQGPSPMTFGFHVSCVETAAKAAATTGGTITREPYLADWGRSATVTDPDGNRVLLMQHCG